MLAELRADRQHIEQAILVLERLALGGAKRRGRPPKWMTTAGAGTKEPKPKRTVSAAARQRMAAAQKKRWAAIKAKADS